MKNLSELIKVTKGEKAGTLLLKNGRLLNLFTGEIEETNILIYKNLIAGIGTDYQKAEEVYDLKSLYILPGFIESHIHIESSMLSLKEFTRLSLLSGTTIVVADPHEIANVMGISGIKYFLKASAKMPIDYYFTAPSSVPASPFEEGGGKITSKEIGMLFKNERVIGLGEVMNFPGLIACDKNLLKKITLAQLYNKMIDGHCPGLSNKNLLAYISAGIYSDHEVTNLLEAEEKLKRGMYLMIREGSAAKNLDTLRPIINEKTVGRLILVSDDIHPEDLINEGHLNRILRKAVKLGIPPYLAVRMVTSNPATFFMFKRVGAIIPGYKADIAIVNNLKEFKIISVIKNGQVVVKDGLLKISLDQLYETKAIKETIKITDFRPEWIKVKSVPNRLLRVIKIIPNQIITEELLTYPKVVNDEVISNPERDILKIIVANRYQKTSFLKSGKIGVGFVSGFGFKKGAIASSVAHDSHHIIACGVEDNDIALAIKKIIQLGGGMVACAEGEVKEFLPLPIAGLMSDWNASRVVKHLNGLIQIAKSWGSPLANPFITLSFLALSVIPEIKITDRGLFSVKNWQFVSLWS